jgi:hypothetical protein
MGRLGRERVLEELAWSHQQRGYLAVFDELTGHTSEMPAQTPAQPSANQPSDQPSDQPADQPAGRLATPVEG